MGKDTGTQKVTQETKLPAWYESAAQDTIKFANTAADKIAMPYMGNAVAGLTDLQKQAIGLTGQNIGSTNAGYGQAMAGAQGAMGYKPQNFLQGDVGAYMSPYIKNVEDAARAGFDQQFAANINSIGDEALGQKAFGGSRHGVREGVAAAESARQMGEFSANLRNQAFGQAQGMMQSDMDRAFQGANLNMQGSQLMGQLTNDKQMAYLQSLQSALAAGQISQQQAQMLLDQQKAQYEAMRQVPIEQLNIKLSALGGTQVPTSSTTKSPTTGNSLISGIGAAGTAAAGAAALLPLLGFSDERAKTNIEPLGVDGMTGLPMYAYDYKADVESSRKNRTPMPMKRVGPMAQDIERMYPGSTGNIGGKMVVTNLGFGG